jgi:hypothetical protein
MRRVWVKIIATAMVLAAVVALVLRNMHSVADTKSRTEERCEAEYIGIVAEYDGGAVCEVLVDMGAVLPSTTVTKTIRITNCSTTPLVLVDYSTQCRCMWLEYSREPIAENEYRDIELVFDSRGEWGSVGNYMEITTSGEHPIVLWIGAEIE